MRILISLALAACTQRDPGAMEPPPAAHPSASVPSTQQAQPRSGPQPQLPPPSAAFPFQVTDAMYFWADGKVHLIVDGDGFIERAVPLQARVGDQIVHRMSIANLGRGFAGSLEREPRDGDRLFVGYEELQPTSVTFRRGPAAGASR